MNLVLVLVLAVVALYFLWNAFKGGSFDWKQGAGALVAAAAAAWSWMHDVLGSLGGSIPTP